MNVIVAIEPRSYRQAIGKAIRSLRPHVEVIVMEPDNLGVGVGRLSPELVLAGKPDTLGPESGSTGRPAWMEFRPYEEPPARVCLAGRRWELRTVEFSDLLSVVDETAELARMSGDLGNC
jgi:hypothetical protein